MPSNELKQRKKTPQGKQDDRSEDSSKSTAEEQEANKDGAEGKHTPTEKPTSQTLDLRTIACLLCVTACLALSWLVFQQNLKFAEVEEKYRLLHQKTEVLQAMENEIGQISKKLDSSENALQGAISSTSMANKLQQDISGLHAIVSAMEGSERSASVDIQSVNRHFLNVTETWEASLKLITRAIGDLKAESRAAHARVTEKVNEAEGKVRDMRKRLGELEDSTRMNARVLENTEQDDAGRIQDQLDWNTQQIRQLEERQRALLQRDEELQEALAEHLPRAERCQEHLPAVEEAVRSILRLTADLSAAQRRVEELTLQVFGVEDSALKAVSEILAIQQALDAMQADNSILKMRNELGLVKEAVREMYQATRKLDQPEPPEREEGHDGSERDELSDQEPTEMRNE
ncbi:hypothetical protein GJAV_G00158830 [Gymnothorax javanicus]|nr:hypothetical protein GJAV_G00158830 [Gymnothorax javanicus]